MKPPRTSVPPPDRPGFAKRAGEACLRGLGVAILASVPAALRTRAAGGSLFDGLLVSAGVILPIAAAVLILSGAAGRGLRNLVGGASPRPIVLGVALWTGLSLAPIAKLGAVLKATTHHRGLGGATFGILALVIAVVAALLARRLLAVGDRLVARGVRPALVAAVGAAIAVVPTLIAATPLGMHGEGPGGAAVRATILDGAIVLVATALASSLELPASLRRMARLVGIPLAALVFFGAGARVELVRGVGRSLQAGGGFAATVLGVFEHWTDKDGDGEGAHFGGFDCDDGDPSRHSGAAEVPGDGIDQDCDGIDPPGPSRVATSDEVPAPERAPSIVPVSIRPGAGRSDDRPDVLLITLDTVGAGHTSAYGYEKATTPALTELAGRGTLFAHAYATGADPQRALTPLVSGRRLQKTPHDKRTWPTLLPETDTLAERLERSGYRTAAVTSFTWLSRERGFDQGFRIFKPVFERAHPERQVTGAFAVEAAAEIAREAAGDPHPLFLWVHLFDAHETYLPHHGGGCAGARARSIEPGKGKVGAYDGEVAFVDGCVEALITAFTKSRGAGRTAIFVHGSHGEAFGEHRATGHGGDLFEEVLHVPLVASIPGGSAGTYDAGAVSTVDLAPTIAELASAPVDGLEGRSLLPILRGDRVDKRGAVFARTQKRAAVVDWPLKVIASGRGKKPKIALFDLAADPHESRDLSEERGADVARLMGSLGAFEGEEP